MVPTVPQPNGSKEIPHPTTYPIVGNLPQLYNHLPLDTVNKFAKECGPIYRFTTPTGSIVIVSNQELVHAVSDDALFAKHIPPVLEQIRTFAGDGLFTAYGHEHNWALAHRILTPAFGPLAVKKMQPKMMAILTEFLLFHEHHAGQPFEAADLYTRLTLDTIGTCAFNYRFNSFHTSEMHPFIKIMGSLLAACSARSRMPDLVNYLNFPADSKFHSDRDELHRLCDEIVSRRRAKMDPEARDLLNNMILDSDPDTGEKLSDSNIRYQMVTFLIAGHETTSGLLTFATYFLIKYPKVFARVRKEADEALAAAKGVMGDINANSLQYVNAVLKETLRLYPSAPQYAVSPRSQEGVDLPGDYHIPFEQTVVVLLGQLHRDPKIWGPNPEEFKPERWLDGTTYPPDSYKPFGNGQRACIGRGFATQEAVLAIACIALRFDLEFADPNYELQIKQTLTIKPKDFHVIARPRGPKGLVEEWLGARSGVSTTAVPHNLSKEDGAVSSNANGDQKRLILLFGSNTGSCEGLARDLAAEGKVNGFKTEVHALDTFAPDGTLPKDTQVVICTASYEGAPADNARKFVAAIEAAPSGSMSGVKYTVFGAGHHDWASTFFRIPKLIDRRLEELGATRTLPITTLDMAGSDVLEGFEAYKSNLWKDLCGSQHVTAQPTVKATILRGDPSSAKQSTDSSYGYGQVTSYDRLVSDENGRIIKDHLVISLPGGSKYETGDYLSVLPRNPDPTVNRVLKYFGLDEATLLSLDCPQSSFLPHQTPIRAGDLFGTYVELGQAPGSTTLANLGAEISMDLTGLSDGKSSLLEILESVTPKVSLGSFINSLPVLKPRQYSLASTPLEDPSKAGIIFGVLRSTTRSGEPFLGAASNYLDSLRPGDAVLCGIQSSNNFRLPKSPSTPVVMFAAGTGLAPFVGFITERAILAERGEKVGPTVLFYGCRDEEDLPHSERLFELAEKGILDLRLVYSRKSDSTVPQPCTLVKGSHYVQDRVWEERKDLAKWYSDEGVFYTCGSGARLGSSLKETLIKIIAEHEGTDASAAQAVWDRVARERYHADVFL